MITLTFTVDDINTVLQVYNRIQVARSSTETGTYTVVSGTGFPITLLSSVSSYEVTDTTGEATDWYKSRYYSTSTLTYSSWSDPVLGSTGDLFYNPLYPEEVSYGTAEKLVINRIRRLIGDPVGLRRDSGTEAASAIHFDNRTFELDEKGWPVSVYMGGMPFNSSKHNPSVNGYRYLRFSQDIDDTTWSGCTEYGADIWYYTFRHSDREIMYAYDTCPIPTGLTTANVTSEAYMLKTAYELLYSEFWEDTGEDGAVITDEGTRYDPSPGLDNRRQLLDRLKKRLDELVQSLTLTGITGVLID